MVHQLDITARLQRRMLQIVGDALPLITKARADADLIGLAHLRGEMTDAIAAYCRHIDRLQNDAINSIDRLERLADSCIKLQAAYESFRIRWVHRDDTDYWHEYRLSAVVMMKQVRSLVQDAERGG